MKHSEQLRAWAIDRAIETHKVNLDVTADQIVATAKAFVEYAAGPDVEDELDAQDESHDMTEAAE